MVGGLATVLAVLALYFLSITDDYIEKRRPTTLIYEPDAHCRQTLRPGQSYRRSAAIAFEIGPHRMRGEVPGPKAAGTKRLFVVGGSSVFDHLNNVSWPERIAEEARRHGVDVQSFNGGVPGYTSRDSIAFHRDRVARYEPDIVVLYQGWNDVKYFPRMADGEPFEKIFPQRSSLLRRYEFLTAPRPTRNLKALEMMWKERSMKGLSEGRKAAQVDRRALAEETKVTRDWSATPGARFLRRNVEDFINRVRGDGGEPVLVVQATLATPDLPVDVRPKKIRYDFIGVGHADLLALNDTIANVLIETGKRHDVRVLDFREEMNGRPEYFSDHVHLSAAGSKRLAQLVADGLFQRSGAE